MLPWRRSGAGGAGLVCQFSKTSKNEQKCDSANQIPEPVRLVPWLSWLLQSCRGQRGKREAWVGAIMQSASNAGTRARVSHDGFGFASDWLREWHKIFWPITKRSNTYLDKILGDVPSFCNIFTSQSTWVITVLCFFFGLATAPVLLTKWDGTVSSPNYPFTYPTNTTLTWIKTVSSGNRITITIDDFQVRNSENPPQPAPRRSKYRAIPHLFERLFLI